MLKTASSRFSPAKNLLNSGIKIVFSSRFDNRNLNSGNIKTVSNEQQAPYYTAKDIEFCPNRSKDLMQNNVEETSNTMCGVGAEKVKKAEFDIDEDHKEAYRANYAVSLYSVMQSNVPDPPSKSPTHLNMPGSSSSRDQKYRYDKMQTTHHSRQIQ